MKATEAWRGRFRVFETARVSLDALRPFGEGAEGGKKKEK